MTVLITDERRYPHGVPCWVDTAQLDPPAAARFYGELFGWELTEAMPPDAPGSYLIATLDRHDVAAIASMDPDEPPAWRTYVSCDDADTAAEAVVRAGGTVVWGPEDAGPAGRTATCADPAGALFQLWQARRRLGAQVVNVPSTWNFSNLHTPDPDLVLPFYRDVFGWEVSDDLGAGMIRLPGYGDHLAATVDPDIHQRQAHAPAGFADVVAGLSQTDSAPEWAVRFSVADRDASAATAERLGATVVSSDDTYWTKEALIRDPQGAELTLSQFTPPG
jgi:predicted enzyme related to lactoylglutathione lyase